MMPNPHMRTGSHPDVKPRLTKEQHDILESHFQQQHKPSTNTKKGFADNLGVPLDKINNWFQNRRAKVKQDAKKAQNAREMLRQTQMIHQQGFSDMNASGSQAQQNSLSASPGLFSSASSVSPSTCPVETVPSAAEMQARFALQDDFNHSGLGSISEGGTQATQFAIMKSLMSAGYDFSGDYGPSTGSAVLAQQQYPSNLQIPSNGGFGDSMNGSLDFSNFTPASSTMHHHDSIGSASSDLFNYSAAQFTPATSVNPTGSFASLPQYNDDVDSDVASNGGETFNRDFNFARNPASRHHASSSQTSLPIFPGHHFQAAGLYQQSNHSSQVIITSPEQLHSNSLGLGDLEPPNPPFANGVYSRRSSSTSNLAETMQGVGIQSRGSVESLHQQAASPSTLAARRQRRPAPLGSNGGTRSASYTPGMPGSPSGSLNSNADQSIRRIRSSQNVNGRVQKNSGSARQSPVVHSFEQAANSPKFARQLSEFTNENSFFPAWQSTNELKSQGGIGDSASPPDSLSVPYRGDSTTDGSARATGSPPEHLSIEAGNLDQAFLASNLGYSNTPPHSAPPTQQDFPQAIYMPQTQQTNEFLAPQDFGTGHLRSPSLPATNQQGYMGNQNQTFSTNDYTSEYNFGLEFANSFEGSFMNSNAPAFSLETAPSLSSTTPDLYIHQYDPPQAGSSRSESRQPSEKPKNFVFANAGPNDYKSG